MSEINACRDSRAKSVSRVIVAVFFVIAGALHFLRPAFYLGIMPLWLPEPLALIYLSGVFEILGGIGLLPRATRRFSGICLNLLLLAVLPANAQMLIQNLHSQKFSFITVILILRLPLQFVFMAIVNRVSK